MLSVAPPEGGSQRLWIPYHQPSMTSKRPRKKFRCDYVHKMAGTDHLSFMEYVGLGPACEEGVFTPGKTFSYSSRHGEGPAIDLCSGPLVLCPAPSPPGLPLHWELSRKTLPPTNPKCPPGLLINGPCAPMTSTHQSPTATPLLLPPFSR